MKIIQEKIVYEDGEKFYCIYFDDDTYVCLAEDEYYDLMKIIKNGSQSDLRSFIDKSSTQNITNTSGGEIGNIGMAFSLILGMLIIWIFNKTFQFIPLVIGILTLFLGLYLLRVEGFIKRRFPHIIWAILYGILGAIAYSVFIVFLLFMIDLTHLCFGSSRLNKITEASGFDITSEIGFWLTVIGACLTGAYYDSE